MMAALAVTLLVTGCRSSPAPESVSSPSQDLPRGGTLRLAVPHDIVPPSNLASSDEAVATNALDPQFSAWYDAEELQRCCLSRTLVSYVGNPTDRDGTALRPDLAASLPEVSSDELTWTFRLRAGIHYGPPLEDTEVTSADFVRTFNRVLPRHAGASGFATLTQLGIVGVPEYLAGEASTVSGLETPDRYTLRIRLVRPAGDLPARFALPDTAPIPPSPADAAAPLGVATGHDDDYGRFMVATGPYMVEGSGLIDFALPAEEQVPAAGYAPAKSLTLVRNPSWDPATDDLRPAYVDRIEIEIGGTLEEASDRLDKGEIDFVFNAGSPPQSPVDQIERFSADQGLGRVYSHSRDIIRYIEMNLALPPFDDIHVRKAMNLAIDKAGLIQAAGERTGEVAGHMVLDSLEDNLLLEYDPYRTPGSHGDPAAARDEMRLSRYDGDGDGRCDDPVCSSVGMVTFRLSPEAAELVVANLAEIGITAEILATFPPDDVIGPFHDPRRTDRASRRRSMGEGHAQRRALLLAGLRQPTKHGRGLHERQHDRLEQGTAGELGLRSDRPSEHRRPDRALPCQDQRGAGPVLGRAGSVHDGERGAVGSPGLRELHPRCVRPCRALLVRSVRGSAGA